MKAAAVRFKDAAVSFVFTKELKPMIEAAARKKKHLWSRAVHGRAGDPAHFTRTVAGTLAP